MNVIAAYRVGRSEAYHCARLDCVLLVAVFGAQHHCAACCAVLFPSVDYLYVGKASELPTHCKVVRRVSVGTTFFVLRVRCDVWWHELAYFKTVVMSLLPHPPSPGGLDCPLLPLMWV